MKQFMKVCGALLLALVLLTGAALADDAAVRYEGGAEKFVFLPGSSYSDSDLFAIVAANPYTSADLDWRDKQSRSTLEAADPSCRPAITSRVERIEDYDIIFLGFPIWWYVAPAIVNTFLVEAIFNWPGVGSYAVDSIKALDVPAIIGVTLLVALLYVLANLLVDLVQAWLDPRITLR